MLFDTLAFFVFLAPVVAIYWRLQWRSQNIALLAASYFFYGWWDWRFLGLIAISTVVDFYCAHVIARSPRAAQKRSALALSVILNVSFLGFFKYFNFFVDSLAELTNTFGLPIHHTTLQILLPPGISFYTFQALAYIVDVYYRRITPANSFVDYALFISLFPHLIAGPIQRPSHLLPQVQAPRVLEADRFFGGCLLIATGLFRKCVVADNCSLLAEAAFTGRLGEASLPVLAIGSYAFAWQIYGDFSGYSDIARGSAQLLGFHFMVNFRQPYFATSIQDFWRRWHISLSTWLRDYLYIPLGGNRGGEARTYRNLMLTMVLGGLWHGANWTFVIWGAIHGAALSFERLGRALLWLGERPPAESRKEMTSAVSWMSRVAIFHVVCVAWVFFRAGSMSDAMALLKGATRWRWSPEFGTAATFLAAFVFPLVVMDFINEVRREEYLFERADVRVRVAIALSLMVSVFLFTGSSANAFIYFQF